MRDRIFNILNKLAVNHPGKTLLAALVVTILAGIVSENLKMSMRWSDLLPEQVPTVREFNRIIESYDTASSIFVVLQGEEADLKKIADATAGKIEKLEHVKRVDYKVDIDFIRKHGYMITKNKDLENSVDMFSDLNLPAFLTNINNNLEKTYVYNDDEEKLSNKEKTDNAIMALEGIKTWLKTMDLYVTGQDVQKEQTLAAVDKFLYGEQYYLSYNKSILLMMVQPNFAMTDAGLCVSTTTSIKNILTDAIGDYPGTKAGLAGGIALAADEMNSVEGGMIIGILFALIMIFLLFIFAFRMWLSPLMAMIALIAGVIWTFAFAAVTVGSLNILTSMMGMVLVGLGIDFSIHVISSYTENRGAGRSIAESMERTFKKTGSGIMTGALTTSIAFFTLCVAENRGMEQFGLVCGSGVLLTMAASFLILPSLIILFDKRRKEEHHQKKGYKWNMLGTVADKFSKTRYVGIALIIIITGFLAWQASNIGFEYDMLKIEPKDAPSVVLPDTLIHQMDLSPDVALITVTDLDTGRIIVKNAKRFKNISLVESITNYIPSASEQAQRRELIEEIRTTLKNNRQHKCNAASVETIVTQLDRLWMNVVEMSVLAYQAGQDRLENKCYTLVENSEAPGSGDYIKDLIKTVKNSGNNLPDELNRFQNDYYDYFKSLILQMSDTSEITLKTIPQNIKNRYLSKDGTKYLISIYPKQNVWDIEGLRAFDQELQILSPRSTGTPSLMLTLIDMIGKDGKIAAVLAIFIVILLLYLDFRKLSHVIFAMIPLVVGAVWMVGLVKLVGIKMNVVNVMALPLIIGIGIDDGVHIVHRFRKEAANNIFTVFSSCGKAILITSLTTMISFASLSFMSHRGMVSLGYVLVIGIGCCFITTVLILSLLFNITNRKPE